jgi:hypothetical protein
MPKQRIVMSIIGVLMLSLTVSAEIKVYSYGIDSAVKSAANAPSQETSSVVRPSSVVATSSSSDLVVKGFWYVNSGVSQSDGVSVMRVAFNNFLFDSAEGSLSISDINLLADETNSFTGGYFYPNPFSFKEGGELNYRLTGVMDIEIHMYDIFGHKIYQKTCTAGSGCGASGELQSIKFDAQNPELNGHELSAGVYFYLFINNGEVIRRGKVAIVP